jgi:hypothetical protein
MKEKKTILIVYIDELDDAAVKKKILLNICTSDSEVIWQVFLQSLSKRNQRKMSSGKRPLSLIQFNMCRGLT